MGLAKTPWVLSSFSPRGGQPTWGLTEDAVPGGVVGFFFLNPHLTLSTPNSPVCGLWGGCTGAEYRSDGKEREKEEKYLQKQSFKSIIGSQGPKTVSTALRASHVRHGDAETSMHAHRHVCTHRHTCRHRDSSQRQARSHTRVY